MTSEESFTSEANRAWRWGEGFCPNTVALSFDKMLIRSNLGEDRVYSAELRRGCPSPWNSRQMWAAIRVLRTDPASSTRGKSALNFSSRLSLFLLKQAGFLGRGPPRVGWALLYQSLTDCSTEHTKADPDGGGVGEQVPKARVQESWPATHLS